MPGMKDRRFNMFACGVAVAAAAALSGCSGGDSGSQQQASSGGFFGLFARQDPNADLTPAEGQRLIAEMRKDPTRISKLTPGERRFLAKVSAAMNARK